MLGSAPIADVIEHSAAFLAPLAGATGTIVDLGSGGGVPGLVLAWMRPDLEVVLVDRRSTRTDHLRRLVRRVGIEDRVRVLTADAAALPRLFPRCVVAVVARSFGPPVQVLRAARPVLAGGGSIVVSEPPPSAGADRWPPPLLDRFQVRVRPQSDRRVIVLDDVSR